MPSVKQSLLLVFVLAVDGAASFIVVAPPHYGRAPKPSLQPKCDGAVFNAQLSGSPIHFKNLRAPWPKEGPRTSPLQGTDGFNDKFSKIMENVMEGTIGKRGEVYVGLQFLLVFLVFIGPVFGDLLEELGLVMGLTVVSMGLLLGGTGVLTLGDSLSPWPKPVDSNELQTGGPFSVCRHPIYGGLLISCFGLSLVTASYPRLFFTIFLYLLLDLKADKEEQFLEEKHVSYSQYKTTVPRFFPNDVQKVKLVPKRSLYHQSNLISSNLIPWKVVMVMSLSQLSQP